MLFNCLFPVIVEVLLQNILVYIYALLRIYLSIHLRAAANYLSIHLRAAANSFSLHLGAPANYLSTHLRTAAN